MNKYRFKAGPKSVKLQGQQVMVYTFFLRGPGYKLSPAEKLVKAFQLGQGRKAKHKARVRRLKQKHGWRIQ